MLIPIYLKHEIRPEDLVYRTANQINATIFRSRGRQPKPRKGNFNKIIKLFITTCFH